jgi:hypothetical protein
MALEYDTFVDTLDSLKEEEEIELIIRDTTAYEARKVRAIVSSADKRLPDGATLWIRFNQGILHRQPWFIKVIKELGSPVIDIAENRER